MIHSNRIAECIFGLGFKGILCEGVESLLNGRSPNHPYSVPGVKNGCLLLRNSRLSDDIAFRFDDKNWSEHPLTAEKFAEWIHAHPRHSEVINISMDYETFGLHKSPESNIFEFLKALPAAVIAQPEFRLSTASETLEWFAPKDFYDVPNTISWEDMQSASCVWTNNVNQHNTLGKIYSLEKLVRQSGCPKFLETWRHLQSADNFYFMDGQPRTDKKKYINLFSSASEAFMNYTNIVTDFEISLIRKGLKIVKHGNRAKTKQHLFY